ncbi:MAG TPA: sigma-70 family RNA polymerase sigma factor [Candidatus Binatia bacterium]
MERATAVDDGALIRGALAGRREDFDALVERYQKALYAFIYRLVHEHAQAADIAQMTFLQAYTHLGQFAGRASFKTWLHQIALNQCRAAYRAARGRHHVSLDEMSEAALHQARLDTANAATATAGGDAGGSDWKPVLERLIARLPLRQRSVVTLRIFSDLPFREIARVTGISENAAKVNYHYAITHLRQWLREDER